MAIPYEKEIYAELARLPEGNLKALLEALRAARPDRPLRRWSSAVGTLGDEDAEQMRGAVEEGCEVVDADQW